MMADNIYLGNDIALINGDIAFSANQDFEIIKNNDNLKQAVYNRIATFKGELFNKEYGSEVYKCLGEKWTNELNTRLTGFIFEALNQEPRVKEITDIEFKYDDIKKEVTVKLSFLPINENVELNLVFPLFIG